MRVIVSALFRNFNNEILLARRKEDGKYTTPGGKVEENENILGGLYRETLEETGITIDSHKFETWIECRNKLVMCYWITTWRGEPRQKEPHKHGPWYWLQPSDVSHSLTEGLLILHGRGII